MPRILRHPSLLFASGILVLVLLNTAPAGAHEVPESLKPALLSALLREGPADGVIETSAIFAIPEYWHLQGLNPDEFGLNPERDNVFLVLLNVHVGDLPYPNWNEISRLVIDEGKRYTPTGSSLMIDSPHHQTVGLVFPKSDGTGMPLIGTDNHSMKLVMSGLEGLYATGEMGSDTKIFEWNLPLSIPQDALPKAPAGYAGSLALLLPIFGGFLVYLSPCFAELTAVYVALISGIRVKELETQQSNRAIRKRVVVSALLFVAGFASIYTVAGVVAGYGGQLLQGSAFELYSLPLRVGSGAFLVYLGVASSGLLKRIPVLRSGPIFPRAQESCRIGGSFVVGITFGCLQCFRGSIVLAMLIYAWALGSPSQGALMLLLLSLSFGVPFILVAFQSGRNGSFLDRISPKLTTYTSKATSILLVFLGASFIVYDQHPLLDAIHNMFEALV